jgi:phage-related protein (TIGR01555 family)
MKLTIKDKILNKLNLQTKPLVPKNTPLENKTDLFYDKRVQADKIQDEINKNIIHEQINDNLVNVMSKASAQRRDVTNPNNNYFSSMPTINYQELENIYMSTWVGKKIIDLPNKYIFKNGFSFKIGDGTNKKLEEEVLKFYHEKGLEKKVKEANAIKRIYGGGIILIKDKNQDPMQPYDYTKFYDRTDIEFIARDLSYLAVTPYIEIVGENYFEPHIINLAGVSALAENCILFKGIQAPKRRMPQFRYLGMSIFQNIYQAMINDEYVSKGIVNMIYRGNMKYYKLEGYSDLVKQGYEELAISRISAIEDYSSHLSAGILDKNDDVSFVQQSFASLAEIDERSIKRLAAASNIPATILLNEQQTGLGNASQGEQENFYNYIEEEQHDLEPAMKHVFRIIVNILSGQDEDIEFSFNKPHNIDPQTQANIDKIVLENIHAQQALGFNDEILKDYAVRNKVITSEQALELTTLKNEMLEMENLGEDGSTI